MEYVVINKDNEVVDGVFFSSELPTFEEENSLTPVEVLNYSDINVVPGQVYNASTKSVEDTDRSLENKHNINRLTASDYLVIKALELEYLKGTVVHEDRQNIRDLIS